MDLIFVDTKAERKDNDGDDDHSTTQKATTITARDKFFGAATTTSTSSSNENNQEEEDERSPFQRKTEELAESAKSWIYYFKNVAIDGVSKMTKK